MPNEGARKHVIAYDHTTTLELKGGLLTKLGELARHSVHGLKDEATAVEEMKDAAIVIAHCAHDQNWCRLLDESPPNTVRIRVSTVSRSGYLHQVTAGGVIELNMQVSHALVEHKEWAGILRALSDVECAKKTALGFVPADLERYFATSAPEHLVALSILCQGYLAVAEPAALDNPGGFVKDEAILRRARSDVQSPAWWLDVLDPVRKATKSSELSEIVKEWPEPPDQDMRTHWETMHRFLGRIIEAGKRNPPEFLPRDLGLAKDAYMAISARLKSVEAANKA